MRRRFEQEFPGWRGSNGTGAGGGPRLLQSEPRPEKKKARRVAGFFISGGETRRILARVQFDNELLVDDGIDLFAGRDPGHRSAEVILVNDEPIRRAESRRLVDRLGGKTL